MRSALAFLLLTGAVQESSPGLVSEYFGLEVRTPGFPSIPAGQHPILVRVEPNLSYPPVTGNFYGTKLSTAFFGRWTGFLRCEQSGLYNFYLESEGGSRLYIDQELIVDNAEGRAMEQKAGRLTLAAGNHAFRYEYVHDSGASGLNLQWKTPKGNRTIVPKDVLFHLPSNDRIDWDREAWQKRLEAPPMQPAVMERPGRYATIDFGPFLSRSIGPDPVIPTGQLLRVAPDATVCFDSQLLRVAAAWTGPFLNFPSEKDGVAGVPQIAGKTRFTNSAVPGWGDPRDPRPLPFGPLPRERGHWRGLYLHGSKVVLSYSVGPADILELHGYENGAFTRTIRVAGVRSPLSVLLAPSGLDAGLAGEGASLSTREGRLELEISRAGTFKVSIPKAEVSAPEDLDALTHGGPPRWTQPVETTGVLGKELGAYQVDTLTVPYENPWNSYMRLVALDFFPDGRAVVATLDGDVWIVSGIDDGLRRLTWKRFATGLYQPLGIRVVDGLVYALGRDQITRLHDLNGDGEADFYENFNNDCMVGPTYGEYAMDLQVGPEGDFYYAKSGVLGPRGSTPHSGCVLRVSKDGARLEIVALGFRAPLGLCVGPDGFITATDQQGNYMAECPIVNVKPGGFYGFALDHHPETRSMTREPAICWLPMDVDNSSGGQIWVTDDRWGPLRGRLVHTSYGQSRLLLVVMDPDRSQGGVVRFPLNFASGIMRAQFNPRDGQLYVAGLRGWQTTAVKDGCLQRVRYTGKPALLPVTLKVRKAGLDIGFTDALDPETAGDPDSYSSERWNVVSTPDYGSPEFNVTQPQKRGREKVGVTAARLLEDGKTVSIDLEDFRAVTNLNVKYSLRSRAGVKMQGEISLTVNHVPDR